MVNFINADCMDILATYTDGAFDIGIIDPPYGIKAARKDNTTRGSQPDEFGRVNVSGGLGARTLARDYGIKDWDDCAPDEDYFTELFRVCKDVILFGANHYLHRLAPVLGPKIASPCWIVWDKVNGGSDFADCELAFTTLKGAVRQFTFQWNGMLQGNRKERQHRFHPTEKPFELYEWLLLKFTAPGAKILDTHGGSCSIAVANHRAGDGRQLTVIEKDVEYLEKGRARYELFAQRQKLFY